MNKVVRDGKVAVIYSPHYGAGWYSWHLVPELVFDPAIVDMVDRGVDYTEIVQYCEKQYPSFTHCYLGAEDLTIAWVEEGREFQIEEYDGSEKLRFKDQEQWIVA
jgi:hypothetical protein